MTGLWNPVGQVVSVWRYPVKGIGGEGLVESRVGWHGVAGDRRFALRRVRDVSGLPWVSPREFPKVVSWRARDRTASSELTVTLCDGDEFIVPGRDMAAWVRFARRASTELGEQVELMSLWRGTFDSMPLSLVTTESVAAAALLVEDPSIDVRRFRPNVVVSCGNGASWPESKWVGREVRIGEGGDATVLRVDRHTTRCQTVDVDPQSGERTYELFERIRLDNRNRLGVYASTVHVGSVGVGALVSIR